MYSLTNYYAGRVKIDAASYPHCVRLQFTYAVH
jgi:hypothetical protein